MKRLISALALGASLVAAPALAQTQTPPPAQGPVVQAQPGARAGWLRNMTRDEAKQRADMMFQRFDLNHDVTVTRQEANQVLAQLNSGGDPARSERMGRMIDRLFGGAQSITQAQFEGQMLARYDAMHANAGTAAAPRQPQPPQGQVKNQERRPTARSG